MGIRADSESLRELPLFRDCDPVAMQVLCFAAEKQEFSSGDEIITQGKKARAAFLMLDGRAQLSAEGRDVAMAEAGALLGEAAMLRAGPYSITAKASGPVVTLRVTHDLFLRVAKEYPVFGRQVLQNLADKLGQQMRDLEPVRAMLTKSRSFSDLR